MDRRTEILHQPMQETEDDATLLGISRLPGEREDTFRARVAYAMHLQLEKPVTGAILLRLAYLAIRANLEAQGKTVTDLCAYKGNLTAFVR